MDTSKQTLVDYVRANARVGSLREQLINYVNVNPTELPRNDRDCRTTIEDAMRLYFEMNGLPYVQSVAADVSHPFVDYVRANARVGSLREQLINYVNVKPTELPIDNQDCRAVVTKAIDTYF